MAIEMQPKMQIKGVRDGLLVTLGEGSWEEVFQLFIQQIDQQLEFLRGARLMLDVGNHVLKAVEMSRLRDELSERGLQLWGVLSNSPTTESTAQTLGLATRISKPVTQRREEMPAEMPANREMALMIHRTLRSGSSVKFAGHVVVIGDVNPGAEIIAGGNVVVWGRLSGVVHAGAEGDESAVVCALNLAPTQLRIASSIAIPPKRRGRPQPEMARLVNGQVVAEAWDDRRR